MIQTVLPNVHFQVSFESSRVYYMKKSGGLGHILQRSFTLGTFLQVAATAENFFIVHNNVTAAATSNSSGSTGTNPKSRLTARGRKLLASPLASPRKRTSIRTQRTHRPIQLGSNIARFGTRTYTHLERFSFR